MVRVLFLFLTRFHVNVARSNGNQQGAKIFPPKFNACVPCVRVLCKTRLIFPRINGPIVVFTYEDILRETRVLFILIILVV